MWDQGERAMESIQAAVKALESGGAPSSLNEVRRAFSEVRELAAHQASNGSEIPRGVRAALEDWKRHLPHLRALLLVEQGRLRSRVAHTDGVSGWMKTQRETR